MGAESRAGDDSSWYGLGRHLIAELHGCRAELLMDSVFLKELLIRAASRSGAHIIGELSKRFPIGGGVSAIVAIKESHLSIHTWPEFNYAAVDVFTCGENVDPWAALRSIAEDLKPASMNVMEIRRGLVSSALLIASKQMVGINERREEG